MIMIRFMLACACALLLTLTSAKAQEDPFDHSNFYQVKIEVKDALFSVSKELQTKPDVVTFRTKMAARLKQIASRHPEMDYTIVADKGGQVDIMSSVMIGYTDKKGFIGWKFDTVFSEKRVYFFSISLADRTIPDLSWEEYYRWNIL